VDILATHASVMRCGVMLGEVIHQVFTSCFPVDSVFPLCNPVFNPITSHIHGFRSHSFRKRESVRPSKHCRYDVTTEIKFRPTFDDEKDENEKFH
jgi:hypothetical protein